MKTSAKNNLNSEKKKESSILDSKRKKVKSLGDTIVLLSDTAKLTREQNQEVENTQYALEFERKQLEEEFAEKELNLKIKSLQKIVDILKNAQIN